MPLFQIKTNMLIKFPCISRALYVPRRQSHLCSISHNMHCSAWQREGNPPTQIINLEIFDKDIQLFKSYTASSVATDTEVLKLDHNHKILLIIIIVLHKYYYTV